MVIQTTINGTTAYLHSAWATDENGADFSLTQFDEAEYVGNIINENPAEESDPALYNWLVIDEDIVAEDDIEDDTDWRVVGSIMNDKSATAISTVITIPNLTRIVSRTAILFSVLNYYLLYDIRARI